MNCRIMCGACCIVPSISSPIPGMPDGKPAGMRCIHLDGALRCTIFDQNDRPEVCDQFKADIEICGSCQDDAIEILCDLEGLEVQDVKGLFSKD